MHPQRVRAAPAERCAAARAGTAPPSETRTQEESTWRAVGLRPAARGALTALWALRSCRLRPVGAKKLPAWKADTLATRERKATLFRCQTTNACAVSPCAAPDRCAETRPPPCPASHSDDGGAQWTRGRGLPRRTASDAAHVPRHAVASAMRPSSHRTRYSHPSKVQHPHIATGHGSERPDAAARAPPRPAAAALPRGPPLRGEAAHRAASLATRVRRHARACARRIRRVRPRVLPRAHSLSVPPRTPAAPQVRAGICFATPHHVEDEK
jgi:hypothetical protein